MDELDAKNARFDDPKDKYVAPRNGIQLRHGARRLVVAETVTNRRMTKIVRGGSYKEYLPADSHHRVRGCVHEEMETEISQVQRGSEKAERLLLQIVPPP